MSQSRTSRPPGQPANGRASAHSNGNPKQAAPNAADLAAVAAAAIAARKAGISVCPPKQDGTKAPYPSIPGAAKAAAWKVLQRSPANDELFSRWYPGRTGLGFVCGAVSGNLECFEFDDAEAYERYKAEAAHCGLAELVERVEAGYLECTPGGGVHWLYFVADDVRENMKLARRPDPTEANPRGVKVLIETRGEGGFVVVAPSFGKVHPSGKPYVLNRGGAASIVTLTGPERDAVWGLARSIDEMAAPKQEVKRGEKPAVRKNGGRLTPESRAILYLDKCPPSISGSGGHDQAFKTACNVGPGFELDPPTTLRLLSEHWNPRCEPPWSERELQHKVDDAYKNVSKRGWLLNADRNGHSRNGNDKPPPANGKHAESPPPRPHVELNTERHRVLEESIKALANDPDVYRRGEFLVGVVQEEGDELRLTGRTSMKGVAGSPKIVELSDAMIGCYLTRNAEFFQWRTDKSGESVAANAHPPDWLIKAVATRKYWPGIRPLSAVVECPFPRPDGSIVETPGYDARTSTLYLPTLDFPKLPDRPTRADARAAWGRLKEYVRQFPFPSEDDRVVVLAGMLVVIARPAISGPVPGIAIPGNKPGTGKGLLTDAMAMPGTGRPAPTSAYPDDKSEAAKVKVSIVLSGKPVVSFDNLDEGSMYGGSAVDSALTSLTIDDRLLGFSKNTGEIPVRTTWFLNGNNISPVKDAWRRWLVCNLTTDLEHPERRGDIEDKSLRSLILDNRREIVRDALVILKAHALDDRPTAGWPPLGSFEEWDRVIRGAVWYATSLDCLATQTRAADDAPDRLSQIALLEGWRELPGGKAGEGGVTSSEAVALVENNPSSHHTLRGVLIHRGRGGKLTTSASLGIILRSLKNSRISDLKLRDTGFKRHGAALWVVESTRGEDEGSREGVSYPSRESLSSDSDTITYGVVCKRSKNGVETPSLLPSSSPREVEL